MITVKFNQNQKRNIIYLDDDSAFINNTILGLKAY